MNIGNILRIKKYKIFNFNLRKNIFIIDVNDSGDDSDEGYKS